MSLVSSRYLYNFDARHQYHVFCWTDQYSLQENNIGQDFALYYLAYAAYMELRGSFTKADAIFQDGLARCAIWT